MSVITSGPGKSIKEKMTTEYQLRDLKSQAATFRQESTDVASKIQDGLLTRYDCFSGRNTPIHVDVEYADLVLIPKGDLLINQIETITNWFKNFGFGRTDFGFGSFNEADFRGMKSSVEVSVSTLKRCRDEFRATLAPLNSEEESSFSVESRCLYANLARMVGSQSEPQRYNKKVYEQQVMNVLHASVLKESSSSLEESTDVGIPGGGNGYFPPDLENLRHESQHAILVRGSLQSSDGSACSQENFSDLSGVASENGDPEMGREDLQTVDDEGSSRESLA